MANLRDNVQAAAALAPLLQGVFQSGVTSGRPTIIPGNQVKRHQDLDNNDKEESDQEQVYELRHSRLGQCLSFLPSFLILIFVLVFILVEYLGKENFLALLQAHAATCNGSSDK